MVTCLREQHSLDYEYDVNSALFFVVVFVFLEIWSQPNEDRWLEWRTEHRDRRSVPHKRTDWTNTNSKAGQRAQSAFLFAVTSPNSV